MWLTKFLIEFFDIISLISSRTNKFWFVCVWFVSFGINIRFFVHFKSTQSRWRLTQSDPRQYKVIQSRQILTQSDPRSTQSKGNLLLNLKEFGSNQITNFHPLRPNIKRSHILPLIQRVIVLWHFLTIFRINYVNQIKTSFVSGISPEKLHTCTQWDCLKATGVSMIPQKTLGRKVDLTHHTLIFIEIWLTYQKTRFRYWLQNTSIFPKSVDQVQSFG